MNNCVLCSKRFRVNKFVLLESMLVKPLSVGDVIKLHFPFIQVRNSKKKNCRKLKINF